MASGASMASVASIATTQGKASARPMAKQKDRGEREKQLGSESKAVASIAAPSVAAVTSAAQEQIHGVDSTLWHKVLAWPVEVLAKMLNAHPAAKEASKLAADEGLSDDDRVKPHLRCPICWGARRGRAARMKWRDPVSPTMVRRCYSCDSCGHEWIVRVKRETVDDMQVTTTKIVAVNSPAELHPKE